MNQLSWIASWQMHEAVLSQTGTFTVENSWEGMAHRLSFPFKEH